MTAQVAITGIGAVSPNGIGREVFWRNCLEGVSGVRKITRFDANGFMVRIAGEVNDLDVDAWVEPKDRPHVPRAVPLARAAVAEALADAGLEPEKMTRDELREIGVSCGSGGAAQEFSEEQYRLFYAGLIKHCSVYVIPSSTPGTMASEISMHFGFRGYSHLISNGCTSSTDAIGYAYRSIKHGVMDTMIAGGTDAPIAPLIVRGFQLMRIMTQRWNEEPQKGSRPFSKDRDGFVLSEGAWFFVLENEEKARARGAKIYGRIEGYGATCEAFHRVRLEESGEEPARAMLLAMKEAGVPPERIDYLQYHGTSTELNDRIESKAVQIAFGNHAERLPGSSVKSIIGHPQGACGAAGMAAALLSMRDGKVHPTINLEEAAPECPLDYVANQSRAVRIEHALANCIAFGSKNSALVIGRAG